MHLLSVLAMMSESSYSDLIPDPTEYVPDEQKTHENADAAPAHNKSCLSFSTLKTSNGTQALSKIIFCQMKVLCLPRFVGMQIRAILPHLHICVNMHHGIVTGSN
jgi:hypothetical protein